MHEWGEPRPTAREVKRDNRFMTAFVLIAGAVVFGGSILGVLGWI